MGSSYFYLEFLLVWHHLLLEAGYKNPAIFSLDYTLVPDDIYPKQLLEAVAGYQHVLDVAKDVSNVCVAGDSAGGTLVLSLLQELGAQASNQDKKGAHPVVRGGLIEPDTPALAIPRMATLISPWVTLMTKLHRPSTIDYLERQMLWRYAHEYAGENMIHQHPGSPGSCNDDELWKASCPERGYFVTYGEEEVFAPDIEAFVRHQTKIGNEVGSQVVQAGVHAWPVASLFLASCEERRLQGLRAIVQEIRKRFVGNTGQENGAFKK
jgi:acetyl esterase/lipase